MTPGAIQNEIGVFMSQVNHWRNDHPNYTAQDELRMFPPAAIWEAARVITRGNVDDRKQLYNAFMRAIGYIIPKEKAI